LALRALVYRARGEAGDIERALNDLGRALEMAEPEGYLRLFVNEGAPMSHLLEAARRRGIRPAYVSRLLAAFPSSPPETGMATPPQGRPDLTEPLAETLTAREVEVLYLISEGLSYEEVAKRLVVSLNTVRFHVKSIYGKLSVEKRSAAIDKARALGLL
jgi:ATP/maltotriose-dependent transcriptional regulator MalT